MKLSRRIAELGALAVLGASVTVVPAAMAAEFISARHIGAVTYLDIDRSDILEGLLEQKEATLYPLEIDFLWGRGAKQTDVDGVKWSIADTAGRSLVKAPASGPVVLAALPDGHYVVTAWYAGIPVQRTVTVHYGEHAIVPLEWTQ